MREPQQAELFVEEDFFGETYEVGSESDAEALASAGFGTDEDYNHYEQDWNDIVYGN